MRTKAILGLLAVGFFWSLAAAAPSPDPNVKIRFLEGIKEGVTGAPDVVTSSYLQPTVVASLQSATDLEEEIRQVRRVFNLKDVRLITEADMEWPKSGTKIISHIIRLDSKEYHILLTYTGMSVGAQPQYKITVAEVAGEKKAHLLDSEFLLPRRNTAVFGFEDRAGKPYFISLYIAPEAVDSFSGGVKGGVRGCIEGGVEGSVKGGVAGAVKGGVEGGKKGAVKQITVIESPSTKDLEDFDKGAVKAEGNIEPPKCLKRPLPVFPEESKRDHFGCLLIMSAKMDKSGQVMDIMVLKMVLDVPEEKADDKTLIEKNKDLFQKAAVDAVKGWLYEPMMIKGKPHSVIFTVTVRFRLND
jgi:hypothetical protein